jgi:hypothetical protein
VIVKLSGNCPIFGPGAEHFLHRLLFTVYQQWHTIVIPTPDQLKIILSADAWSTYGDYLTQAYKRSINYSSAIASHADCANCVPDKVADYYSRPVLVIVENISSYGAWLELIANKLRRRLADRMGGRHPSISFVQAGGIGEIPKAVGRLAPAYDRARPDPQLPLRVVVFSDSDAKLPGQPSQQARDARSCAAAAGADVHILSKRTIENYIPDGALHDYARQRAHARTAVQHVTHLSGPPRDHYPLKTGLTAEELAETDTFYPASTSIGLGLGDFIVDFISTAGTDLEPRELRSRDGAGEFDAILDLLERNL